MQKLSCDRSKAEVKKGGSRMITAEEFFSRTIPVTETGCYLWLFSTDQNGYGRVSYTPHGEKRSRPVVASRVAWELTRGPIPKGMDVCHRCDVPLCVRPDHLFVASHYENMLDRDIKGRWSNGNTQKTHCIHGHPLYGENLYMRKTGHRSCKTCVRNRMRKLRIKKES